MSDVGRRREAEKWIAWIRVAAFAFGALMLGGAIAFGIGPVGLRRWRPEARGRP